jgi:hypothetical protein
MSIPYRHEEPEINPNERHNCQFKEMEPKFNEEGRKYFITKPSCKICGATEETEICNRTFYN